jgi:hypothetical protein
MAKQDFIPPGDNDYAAWYASFSAGVTARQGTFGLTAPEVTQVTNDNTDIHTKLTNLGTATIAAAQAVADKRNSRSGTEARARLLIRRLKAHPNYTPAIGQQLNVIGAEDMTDLANSRPTLTGTAQPHGIFELQFNKSTAAGVNIYSKRDGDADFVFLARDTSSPYVDNRAPLVAGKPENRQYKAIFVQADGEIGQASDIVTLVCLP